VRGTAEPWDEETVEDAVALRGSLVEVVYRHAAQIERLNAQLRRSNEELENFASIASHDLREPLRGIRQAARMLAEDARERLGDDRRQVDQIERLAVRSGDMVRDLFEYARVSRIDFAAGPVDLQALVAEAIDLVHARIVERGVDVRIPRRLPVIRCDASRVRQVFVNLLSNACKYADGPQPWIEIASTDAAPHVLSVRDNGIGIPPEFHERIFDMFVRLHPPEAYGGGTGAGLAIVRRIVERHGGWIRVESAPGAGATFLFTLEEP